MKKLSKVRWINPGLFPAHVGFCNSEKAWKNLMKYLNIKNPNGFAVCGSCDCFDSSSGELTVVVSINPKKFKGQPKYSAYSMLAHEAKHACDALMDHIQEAKPSNEFGAYTIDWLVREGAKAFKL